MTNKLDQIYRRLRLKKYFVNGWGKPENLKRLCEFRKIVSNRETCLKLVRTDYPVHLEKEQDRKDFIVINGHFSTPLAKYMPEVVPAECETAHFQLVLPKKWSEENFKPVIVHIAGTGDQYFWRRRNFIAKPLIRESGIGSIILENPFYGLRKPKQQTMSILQNVSDVFVMGGCLMLETLVLLHFSERMGFGPLGVTGLSMGGHMASICATPWPKPLIIVPCLSGLTASYVFTQGVISHALNWEMLGEQYMSNDCLKNEVQKMIHIIEGDAFKAGQQFAKDLSRKTEIRDTSISDSLNVNVTQFDYDKVTTTLNEVHYNETTKYSLSNVNISSSNLSPSVQKDNVLRKNKDCDNFSNFKFASTNTNDITTFRSSSNNRYQQVANESNSVDKIAENKAADTKTAYINSLLNLIVRLTRASRNFNILPEKTKEELEVLKDTEASACEQQALNFMNGIMDECTHLKNYPVPVDTSLAIAVCAEDDSYVPSIGKSKWEEVWPGAEVRYVKGGHVRAYVQGQKEFRLAIIDAFKRYQSKYITKPCKNTN